VSPKNIGPITLRALTAHHTPTFMSCNGLWCRTWGFSVSHILLFWALKLPLTWNHASSLMKNKFRSVMPLWTLRSSQLQNVILKLKSVCFILWTSWIWHGRKPKSFVALRAVVYATSVSWASLLSDFQGLSCSLAWISVNFFLSTHLAYFL
jgi:hypothetical protein